MEDFAFRIWLALGVFCVIAEFILPGLVMIFIGLGAFTVAYALHNTHIQGLASQFICFFVFSTFYISTLRFAILKLVPSDTKKENINEDDAIIGSIAYVSEDILKNKAGRVKHDDSSWPAKCNEGIEILVGEKVKIIGRENITWLVEKHID